MRREGMLCLRRDLKIILLCRLLLLLLAPLVDCTDKLRVSLTGNTAFGSERWLLSEIRLIGRFLNLRLRRFLKNRNLVSSNVLHITRLVDKGLPAFES